MNAQYLAILCLALVLGVSGWDSFSHRQKTFNKIPLRHKPKRYIPVVPFRNRGQQHDSRGQPSWSFEENSFGRAAVGHFESEKLVNGIPYGKSGYKQSATLYDIEITEQGVTFLNIMTNGGNGDVDIYVKRDDYPTKSNYDVRSAHPGNQEQIIIEAPVPGRYFIVLYGYETYSMIGFEAEYR